MTKKLDKMLTKKKTRRKQPKEKKMTKKQRLAVRGVVLKVGYKRAMELMAEHIKEQKRPIPPVMLANKDPASQFAITMYNEIGQWSEVHCSLYINAVTGAPPQFREPGAMQGTIKAIFHALFDDGASKEEVNHFSSSWKMWPNVRSKPSREDRRERMATKKAGSKAANKKKVASKKAPKRKEKKNVKKKAAKKKSGTRASPITDDTKLIAKKATTGESEAWDAVLKLIPKSGIKFSALCAKVEKQLEGDDVYTRRIVGILRRHGCVEAKA